MGGLGPESAPGTSPEQRLRRILELPRRQGIIQTLTLAGMGLVASITCGMRYERGPLTTLTCAALLMLLAALASVPPMLRLEDRIRPLALELFHRHPEVELPWRWPFWRSLSWYLPYLMGLTVLCVLSAVAALLWRMGDEAARRLVEELAHQGWRLEQVVYPRQGALGVELAWALVLPGMLLLLHAFRIARAMARQMAQGTRELEASLASIAEGTSRLPRWVSTDELGSLSLAMTAIFHQLWTLAREVEEANGQLDEAAWELEASQQQQAHGLARQSDPVNEALATVSEVEQTSTLAAHRASRVLATAERGEGFRRAGEEALAQALHGMEALRAHVTNMAERLGTLEEHARQIGAITTLLHELARECDTVALNASIQAVRAGERGLVFVVIARELRALAERSSQTTREADPLLKDFTRSVREMVVSMRERAGGLRVGLEQAHRSAEQLRQLSRLVEEYRAAAGRIAEAIREQNLDIAEVSREMVKVAKTAEELTKELEVSARLTASVGRMEEPSPVGSR
ncbi:methyl-accepting chemotaxis protein [Cystobacter fuscus]